MCAITTAEKFRFQLVSCWATFKSYLIFFKFSTQSFTI